MPETTPPHGPRATDAGVGVVADLDQVALRRLAEATSAEELCSVWLDLLSRIIGEVSCGAVALEPAEGEPLSAVAIWPRGLRDLSHLDAVIERTVKERRGVVMPSDGRGSSGYLLGYPILANGRLCGVAAMEIGPRDQTQLLAAMRQLQWAIAWPQTWALRQSAWPEAHLKHRLAIALEMAAVVLQERDFRSAATSFLTQMATRLECDRASLGLLRGQQVKVQALSHSADFKRQMNLIRAIGLAMSESLDQQATLAYPVQEAARGQVLRHHEELARAHGGQAVCTVPFVDHEGRFSGALTLERSRPMAFDRATLDVCEGIIALVGPILQEKRRGSRPLVFAASDRLEAFARKLLGPRHVLIKAIAAGAVGVVVFFAFATGQFRVTAKTTLEGQIRRVIAAPYRGFIQAAPVRAGDVIEPGQVLCLLDDRDLQLEHTKYATEKDQYQAEHRKALADGDLAAMNVLTNKMNQAAAQMALLDEQIARARIVGPFRGIVVSGDLSQSLGAPVETGQVLFEIAPLDSYRLMLHVDEWDISYIRPGQTGRLILTALPDQKHPFTINRVTPVSLTEESRSFFRVEARLDEASDNLRPGMEGFAKVDIDRRKLIWIWTHDMIDWIRLKIWSWWP